MKIRVNHDSCSNCKSCVETCPRKIFKSNGKISLDEDRMDLCLVCGHCMAVCNTNSISVEGIENDIFFKLNPFELSEQTYFDFIRSRRSIRAFKDKEVEREKIERIIELVNMAPYGVDPRNVCITVVQNKEILGKSLPYYSEFYDWLGKKIEHPIAKRIIKRRAGTESFNTIKNHLLPGIKGGLYRITEEENGVTRNAPAIMLFHAHQESENFTEDAHICMTYAFLAAHALGLGATVISLLPPAINKKDEIKELYKIPREHKVVCSIILGYPKYKFKKGIRRKQREVSWV